MSDEEVGATGELSMEELVQRELEALRAVDGVTSATAKDRTSLRKPLNTMMAKVRLQGRSNALTVHCGLAVPDLLSAVQKVTADLATIVGEAAIAEGRRRAEAAREAAASAAAAAHAAASTPSNEPGQPLSFFQVSARNQALEAKLKLADSRVRDADAHVRAARLHVAEEEKAVKLAQQRLADARAAAEEAKKPLVQAQAAAAEIRAALQQLRIKRQRVAEAPADPGPTDPGAEAEEQQRPEDESLHYNMYKDYTLAKIRELEGRQLQRRSIIPEHGVPAKAPRRGKDGAMDHWRHGLVGAVQAWAAGSLETVVELVMRLIEHFGISADIRIQLGPASGVRRATSLCRLHRSCPRRCRHLIFRASTVQMTLARSTCTSWTASK